MDRIDNSLDVSIRQLQENPESTPLVITLELLTAFPGLAVADSIWEHFSTNKRIERIHGVLIALKQELEALQAYCVGVEQTLGAIVIRGGEF